MTELADDIDALTGEKSPHLDLLSISQTKPLFCPYGAPLVATVINGQAKISQSCCNHWECPVCGIMVAKQAYRRIVNGCEELAKEHQLYFWTITCRGKECSYDEAMSHYLDWTNVLFTNARTKAKREDAFWSYTQVTEHQQATRAHPHSHIICTFLPCDAIRTTDTECYAVYASKWFTRANFTAKLGQQHKISAVETIAGASRYVAKYMFKSALTEQWPKGWHRVRYSQNFPKLPKSRVDECIILLSPSDWLRAQKCGHRWICETDAIFQIAAHHISHITPAIVDNETKSHYADDIALLQHQQ
ncbi:MAG TPA: hypothetical protein VFG51_04050 [Candidatus Saccharimonadia bacterium]|nr:hypothetical protein [Candidatus Saccharimonadia bacterium]